MKKERRQVEKEKQNEWFLALVYKMISFFLLQIKRLGLALIIGLCILFFPLSQVSLLFLSFLYKNNLIRRKKKGKEGGERKNNNNYKYSLQEKLYLDSNSV